MKCLRPRNGGRNPDSTSIRSLRIAFSSPIVMGIREEEGNSSDDLRSRTSQISETRFLSVQNDCLELHLDVGGVDREGQSSSSGRWFFSDGQGIKRYPFYQYYFKNASYLDVLPIEDSVD